MISLPQLDSASSSSVSCPFAALDARRKGPVRPTRNSKLLPTIRSPRMPRGSPRSPRKDPRSPRSPNSSCKSVPFAPRLASQIPTLLGPNLSPLLLSVEGGSCAPTPNAPEKPSLGQAVGSTELQIITAAKTWQPERPCSQPCSKRSPRREPKQSILTPPLETLELPPRHNEPLLRNSNTQLVELSIAEDVVHAAGVVTIRWEVNPEDPYHHLRHWDFLALHRAGTAPGEYQASLYMLGIECGEMEFCAPLVEGSYTITAVRDLALVLRNLEDGSKKQELQTQFDNKRRVCFSALGSVHFQAMPATPENPAPKGIALDLYNNPQTVN